MGTIAIHWQYECMELNRYVSNGLNCSMHNTLVLSWYVHSSPSYNANKRVSVNNEWLWMYLDLLPMHKPQYVYIVIHWHILYLAYRPEENLFVTVHKLKGELNLCAFHSMKYSLWLRLGWIQPGLHGNVHSSLHSIRKVHNYQEGSHLSGRFTTISSVIKYISCFFNPMYADNHQIYPQVSGSSHEVPDLLV